MYQGVMDLIGFGAVSAVAAATLAPVVAQASSTSAAQTITAPADIIAGDLLVILDRAENVSGTPTSVTPTGFTSINALLDAGGFARQNLSYKIAVGTEGSSTITGMVGTEYTEKAMYVFRGGIPITSVTVGSAAGQGVSTDPTAQVVAASAGTPPLIVIGGYSVYGTGIVDPRTFSTTKNGEINPSTRFYLAYKVYDTSPADTTIDMDDEGAENMLQSCYLAVA
jgi:hypothetical protein